MGETTEASVAVVYIGGVLGEGRGHTDLAVLHWIEISLEVFLLCFEAGPESLISFSEIVPKTSHLGSEEDMYPVE